MKNTMTKAEARELLLNSYTIIGDHDQEEIFSLYERLTGQNREHPLPFGHEDCVAIFNGNLDTWGSKEFSFRNRKPISFEELKSLEIVEEPDYEQKFRECLDCIERMIESANAGKTLPKIDSHTASIGRQFIKENKG